MRDSYYRRVDVHGAVTVSAWSATIELQTILMMLPQRKIIQSQQRKMEAITFQFALFLIGLFRTIPERCSRICVLISNL